PTLFEGSPIQLGKNRSDKVGAWKRKWVQGSPDISNIGPDHWKKPWETGQKMDNIKTEHHENSDRDGRNQPTGGCQGIGKKFSGRNGTLHQDKKGPLAYSRGRFL